MKNLLFLAFSVSFAHVGCNGSSNKAEVPASELPLELVMSNGTRLVGSAARVDLLYRVGGSEPEVRVCFDARGGDALTYSMCSLAPLEFMRTRALSASLTQDPLSVGRAAVQVEESDHELKWAQNGKVSLSVSKGKLTGSVVASDKAFSARFTGPFDLTCSVPAPLGDTKAPKPLEQGSAAFTIDERFESKQCAPYKDFAAEE